MKVWELYPGLTRAINETHAKVAAEFKVAMFYAHDFNHVIRVANMAQLIAPDEETGRVAGIAALCHNADRIAQVVNILGPSGEVDRQTVEDIVEAWFNAEPNMTFTSKERDIIFEAVMNHNKTNSNDDPPVWVTLMDADRVVNIEADDIFRKAQYYGNSLPAIDPVHFTNDPTASFKNPKSLLFSLYRDAVDFTTPGGIASIRQPKAIEIARRRAYFLKLFINEVMAQQVEDGLLPYPTFE